MPNNNNGCKAIEKAIRDAADGFAELPDDYLDLKVKEQIRSQEDWDEYNSRLCQTLEEEIACTILESQLDKFWKKNKTFREMKDYICERCPKT